MLKYIALIVTLLVVETATAQSQNKESERNDLSALLIHLQFGRQLSGGDLAELFGQNNMISAGLGYRFSKSRWGISAHYDYLFGDEVKTDVLADLRTSQGYIIGTDGLPADIFLRERGMQGHMNLTYSRDILKGPNQLSLQFEIGGGYHTHWVRIQDDRQTSNQVRGLYKEGYDRRRGGPLLHQFLGIQYLSFNKRVNFTAGFDFYQAWTQSIRPWNFDTKTEDTSTQFDLLSGFKIGWIIPVYFNESTENIFY